MPRRVHRMKRSLRIFLSFSHKDEAIADAFHSAIQSACPDYRLFYATKSLQAGQDFDDVLHRELRAADVLLSLWTANASTSKWCFHELKYFGGRHDNVVAIRQDGQELPGKFSDVHTIAWPVGWNGSWFNDVDDALVGQLRHARWRGLKRWAKRVTVVAFVAAVVLVTVDLVLTREARKVANIVRDALGPGRAVAGARLLSRLEGGDDPMLVAAAWAVAGRPAPRERWRGGAAKAAIHGSTALVADDAGLVRFWRAQVGERPRAFPLLPAAARDIVGMEDPGLHAVALRDGTVAVLNRGGFQIKAYETLRRHAADPDEIGIAGRGSHAIALKRGQTWVMELSPGGAATRLDAIPFAEHLATGASSTVALAGGTEACFVDLASGRAITALRGEDGGGQPLARTITALAISDDGREVAIVRFDGQVQRAGRDGKLRSAGSHTGGVKSLAFSTKGAFISAGSDGTAKIWEAGNQLAGMWDLSGEPTLAAVLTGHQGAVLAAAFRREAGRAVTRDSAGTIRIWTRDDSRWTPTVLESEPIDDFALSDDGSTLVTVSRIAVHTWNLKDPIRLARWHVWPRTSPKIAVSGTNVVAVRTRDEVRTYRIDIDDSSPDGCTVTGGWWRSTLAGMTGFACGNRPRTPLWRIAIPGRENSRFWQSTLQRVRSELSATFLTGAC